MAPSIWPTGAGPGKTPGESVGSTIGGTIEALAGLPVIGGLLNKLLGN
ncbi:hypothetical protein KPZU09_46180 [Klebsiella pneumoniae]|uniref:Uncharacterized protein n=1 Tax=Klebsiella pneumoniae TaxID=573 RepID=A0A919M0T4_KLEPN|nr:hypothetical protein KPZU09_46180 [Klebsiella pneumoniae]